MNALLFGVAPVTLAAVIVAAFMIVSPGEVTPHPVTRQASHRNHPEFSSPD
jgi:hypothetical protein